MGFFISMSKKAKPLPMDIIRELYELSDSSPSGLRWRVSRSGNKGKGSPVGSLARTIGNPNRDRYFVSLKGSTYRAHRIIYAMHHGVDPGEMQIDHANGDSTDNRIENLRLATSQQNNRNRRIASNNKSGVRGVCWCRSKRKWKAYIMIDGKMNNLGNFDSLLDAASKRVDAEIAHFGEFSPLLGKGVK